MQNGIKLQEQDVYYLLETVTVIDCTQYLHSAGGKHTRQPRRADHEEKITDLGKGIRSVFSFFFSPLLTWGLILSLDLILRHPVMKHNQRVIRLPRSQTAALITYQCYPFCRDHLSSALLACLSKIGLCHDISPSL